LLRTRRATLQPGGHYQSRITTQSPTANRGRGRTVVALDTDRLFDDRETSATERHRSFDDTAPRSSASCVGRCGSIRVDMEVATIGQYRVTGVIGRGGMGAVYAAEHALLGRPAAIKVLLPELSQRQEIVMRFFNEARAATAIRHPGIVEIYDFGWTPEGAAYIVMEHLEGETLSRRASHARLSWQTALAIARQIAGALGAAHAKGIVHRDLKPDNIFLVLDPEVPGGERIKLLDFGIAKLAGDTAPNVHVTRTGAVMGTPTYMAPEQCRGVPIDHRADLYALGCILFELCTGRPPFIGEGAGDVLAAHIHVPPPTLATSGVKVPAAVEHLLQRLLTKSPERRIPSAEVLIADIDSATSEHRAASSPSSSAGRARPVAFSSSITTLSGAATTSEQMAAVRGRRHGAKIAVVSAIAAAVTVVIVALVMRTARDEPVVISHAAATAAPAPVVPTASPPPAVEAKPPALQPAAVEAKPADPPPPAIEAKPPAPRAAIESKPPERARTSRPASPSPTRAREATPRPTIDVVVESVPSGAQLLLGGVVIGRTPYRGALERRHGDVAFVLRLSGYADKTVTVRGSQPISERIKLVKLRDQSVNPFAQ
jgi:serine/threonine protein kinase